ncbi:uncharacterized protein LOC144135101 [Amblyomma americanum]
MDLAPLLLLAIISLASSVGDAAKKDGEDFRKEFNDIRSEMYKGVAYKMANYDRLEKNLIAISKVKSHKIKREGSSTLIMIEYNAYKTNCKRSRKMPPPGKCPRKEPEIMDRSCVGHIKVDGCGFGNAKMTFHFCLFA